MLQTTPSHTLHRSPTSGGPEFHLQDILNSMSDAFIALDDYGEISYLNQTFLSFVAPGSTDPDAWVGAALISKLPEFTTEEFLDRYQQVRLTGRSVTFDYLHEPSQLWFSIRILPLQRGLCLYLHDITEQKRNDDALRESRQRYQSLFESIDSGFCVIKMIFDASGRACDYEFLETNPAFESQTGLHNAVGQSMRNLAPTHEQHWFDIYGRVAKTGESIHFQDHAAALNRWFNVFAFRVGEPAQHRIAILFNDITAQRQASNNLQRRNELLSLLSESARDLLSATDAQQLVHHLFEKVAPRLGLDIFFNFMTDESGQGLYLDACQGVSKEISESYATIPFGHAVCGTVAEQGRRIVVTDVQNSDDEKAAGVKSMGVGAYACHPLRVGNRVIGTLSFGSRTRQHFEDEELEFMQTLASYVAMAKERVRVESDHFEALRREQAASQAKDRFLAVLSHELRTPLTPVLMTVAARETDPDLPEPVREEMAMIRRNIELETKLIDDLLDLSRITTGKLNLQLQSVDLNRIVQQVCHICDPQVVEKNLRLELELAADAGHVHADSARLQQIIWNLLKNAVKFTPAGGTIRVATASMSPGKARTTVTDTGLGIAPHVLPRIFDAFQQGDPSITQQFGGMGLGLAITKAIVDLHNGSISAQSDGANLGSTFVLELPSIIPSVAPTSIGQIGASFTEKSLPNVLLVEDHADTARMLTLLLRRSGFHVQHAGGVAQALQLAETYAFDILVSDLGLPDGDGCDLMRRLQPLRSFVGIAMSGYGMEEDMQKTRQAGFKEHLIKPITIESLKQAIVRLATHQEL